MRPNASKFRVYRESSSPQKYWANYTDENVLLVTNEKIKSITDLTGPMLDWLASAAPSIAPKRTPIQDWMSNSNRVRMVDTDKVKWRLRGTGEIKAMQRENVMAGVSHPGINNTEFQIKLDHEWYVGGDILAPEVDKTCSVIIQGLPEADGTGFIYTVQLSDYDPTSFFPPELLAAGLKWCKIGATYSEASRGYGSTYFGGMSWIEFQSDLSDYGKQLEVTNKAHQLNLRLQATVDGKDVDSFFVHTEMGGYEEFKGAQIINYLELQFIAQAKWEKELQLYYGRSAGRSVIDPTVGYHRRQGAGLLEFLEDGNIIEYPVDGFTLKMFTEFLQAVWFDRVQPAQRSVTVGTGQAGLQLINEAINAEFAGSSIEADFNTFVGKGGATYGDGYQGLVYKTAYFTEIQLFPFGRIRFEHWPILDSRYLNGAVLHPETGIPMSSYEMIVMDYGLGNGAEGSNVEILKRRDSEVFTYECGTWSPAGPINGRTGYKGFTSTGPQRSYILYHTDSLGIRVKDVSLTAWFRPSFTL